MSLSNENQFAHSPYHPWLIAIVVSLAVFMELLDTMITNVSLTHIAGTLGAGQDESTWVLTSYLVANAIILPLSGWLADAIGQKRFFMLCISAFTLASFACGIAESLSMLIFFRLLQGLAGGGLQPTQQSIILNVFPPEKRGVVFAITGITMIVAPILGPALGGWITDNFSWHWIFFINVPIGIISFLLVGQIVQEPSPPSRKKIPPIDYVDLGLVALGLGALQVVLDKGQQDDWFNSRFITTLAIISGVSILAASIRMLKQKDPPIDLYLLAKPSFAFACLSIFFMGFYLYSSSTLLPLLVQSNYGYDALLAGLMLSPGGIIIICCMPIAAQLINQVQARYLIAFGLFLTASGAYFTAQHLTPQINYPMFIIMRILQVVGMPFLFISVSTLAFLNIPKEKSNKASALYALARNLGGSFGISILASYLSRQQQYYQSLLVPHLTPTHPVYYHTLMQNVRAHAITQGQNLSVSTASAMHQFYIELLHQSSILAYANTFKVLGILMTLLIFVTGCMPKNNPKIHKKSPLPGH